MKYLTFDFTFDFKVTVTVIKKFLPPFFLHLWSKFEQNRFSHLQENGIPPRQEEEEQQQQLQSCDCSPLKSSTNVDADITRRLQI